MKKRFLSYSTRVSAKASILKLRCTSYFFIGCFFCVICTSTVVGQSRSSLVERIDPPMWWSGMKWDEVEFLLKGNDLANATVELSSGRCSVMRVEPAKNSKYLYLTIQIPAYPESQQLRLRIKSGRRTQTITIPIVPKSHLEIDPITPADVVYLITPDRFANGNPNNDRVKGFNQTTVNRNEPYERHGGDIAGIASKIDYFKQVGISALWISPLLENNQPRESYHGYAITDLYRIDPRMGTLDEYVHLSHSLKNNGIKLIKDMVFNHFGDRNYLFVDIPDSSWYHWWPTFTRTNYRATTLMDPYRSEYDYKVMMEGWFDTHMPDLNQKNPHLARYLTQNTLYWIETARLSGIRIDTYAYCDQDFMSQWAEAVRRDYPNLYIVAEIWEHTVPPQLFFDSDLPQRKIANTHLDGITDFQLHFAIIEALSRESGWADGINKLYYILSSDYLYKSPERHITFLDNHDVARIFGVLGKDMQKMKIALGWLLTLRGIPCIYYGTEILMAHTDGHGLIRQDFPGGWPEDTINKFSAEGRTNEENEIFQFISGLNHLRKEHPGIATGHLTQFIPRDGLYFYTKTDDSGHIYLIVTNVKSQSMKFNPSEFISFSEMQYLYGQLAERDISMPGSSELTIPAKSFMIYMLK